MSSSRPASSWLRRRSLRARLIAVLVGSLAVICLIVGTVTVLALHTFLVRQLDEQVRDASQRAAEFAEGPPEGAPAHDGSRPKPGQARGLPPGTVTAIVTDGEVDADRQSVDAEPEPLPADLTGVLRAVPADGKPHTRELGGFGAYRLVAVPTRSGELVVAGLPLAEVAQTRLRVVLVLVGVSLAGLLVTGVVGALVVRRTLRPLQRVAQTATEVTTLTLDEGEVALPVRAPGADPGTEVGQVAAALNRMLGHVGKALAARQASESRVRRFVADASHELRTPLASIRGYAELAGRYGEVVPEQVRHAIGRVQSEATRMTALVEDLLLLAKLDAERPVVPEPVDLSRLVADAVADAQVASPDHRWRLELPGEPITVHGDAGQLPQVVGNLLANARTHTPAGTTVVTGLSVGDGVVRLTVTDDGPGIPAPSLPEVFERFARADRSRSRAAGGTGLGLAIVAGVVAAHGGTVDVTSRPGRTGFVVTLPLPAPAPES